MKKLLIALSIALNSISLPALAYSNEVHISGFLKGIHKIGIEKDQLTREIENDPRARKALRLNEKGRAIVDIQDTGLSYRCDCYTLLVKTQDKDGNFSVNMVELRNGKPYYQEPEELERIEREHCEDLRKFDAFKEGAAKRESVANTKRGPNKNTLLDLLSTSSWTEDSSPR